MALTVALHDPIKAKTVLFKSQSRHHGAIEFEDAAGAMVVIYTSPEVAQAVADAFNAAIDLEESE